ncbi:DUF4192 domain-containing protein [Wangella sp. NEAU-J3]|nr:DUF4192 domain-containing protein [Jidongwangia harbinensis]MCA2212677.1 DUF4192 domain-containing protein [Jidongwangia harbinensis]
MTSEHTLKVSSPAELITAVPYLLGFHPADSVVVVAVHEKTVMFAARHDLPAPGAPASETQADADYLAAVVARQNVDQTRIIGYGPPVRVTPAVLRLAEALRRLGVPVDDVLRVADGRYWSYQCEDPRCCPPEGTPYAPEQSVVAAQATFAGAVALPDREALVAQVAAVTGAEREAMTAATARAQARLADLVEPRPRGGGFARLVRRAGRAAVREAERRYRSGRRLTADEAAWLGVLLVDVQVRDYAWERIGVEQWRVGLWTDVLRRVESAYVPAPACLLGYAAWRLGQGALARVAVERALDVDEDYRMAMLLQQVLGLGVSPAMAANGPAADRLELGGGPEPGWDVPPGFGRAGPARFGPDGRGRSGSDGRGGSGSDGRGRSGSDGRGGSGSDGRGGSGLDGRGRSGPDGPGRSGPDGRARSGSGDVRPGAGGGDLVLPFRPAAVRRDLRAQRRTRRPRRGSV